MYGIAGAMDAPGLVIPHFSMPPKPSKMQDQRGGRPSRNRKLTRDQDKKYPSRIRMQEV